MCVHSDYLFNSKNKIKRLHRVVVLFIVPLEHVIVDLVWTRQVSVDAIGQHRQSVDGSYQVGVTRHAPYKQKKTKMTIYYSTCWITTLFWKNIFFQRHLPKNKLSKRKERKKEERKKKRKKEKKKIGRIEVARPLLLDDDVFTTTHKKSRLG